MAFDGIRIRARSIMNMRLEQDPDLAKGSVEFQIRGPVNIESQIIRMRGLFDFIRILILPKVAWFWIQLDV